jgi:ABC-type branched-subunit amino acid transport system ATPase component
VFSKEKSLLKSELLKNFLYEPTLGQYELIEKLCDFIFCTEQNPVFILKGYAGTGKTSIIGALTKSLPTVKQRTLLLAPTGRASKVLGKDGDGRNDLLQYCMDLAMLQRGQLQGESLERFVKKAQGFILD